MTGTVCVVGLGNMGRNIALRLVDEGWDVRGHDLDAGATSRAEQAGLTTVPTLAGNVSDVDFVVASLPHPPAVRAAFLGEDSVLSELKAGAVLVECSTIDPATMHEVGAEAAKRNVSPVDCAVSGGPNECRNGTLLLMVGADDATTEKTSALFTSMGTVQHVGGVGDGKTVKLVNNMMSLGNVLVAAEAFSLGVALGMDPRRMFEVISVSGGSSHHFRKRWPRALDDNFGSDFNMFLGRKDLDLALDIAHAVDFPVPVAAGVREMYQLAISEGFGNQDIVALLRLYGHWAESRDSR